MELVPIDNKPHINLYILCPNFLFLINFVLNKMIRKINKSNLKKAFCY